MSVVSLKIWDEIKPYVYVNKDGHNHPSRRWVADSLMPKELLTRVLQTKSSCVACGKEIRPFRKGSGQMYIAVTCPLEKSIACSRTSRATAASNEIEESIHGREFAIDPRQGELEL